MFDGKLKEKDLTTLPCGKSPTTGKLVDAEHNDGGKLYLVVPAPGKGNRRWVFKFRWPDEAGVLQNKRMGLGLLEMVGLQRARELAFEARKVLFDGFNPMDPTHRPGAPKVAKHTPTFKEFCARIRERSIRGLSKKATQRWDRGVNTYALPLHDLRMETITRHEVQACLDPIWTTIPVAAKRFQTQLSDIFKTAMAAEVFPEDKRNPADYDLMKKLLGDQGHVTVSHKSLPYKLLPAAWQRLIAIDSTSALSAMFTILTGVRTGEAIQAQWDQFSDWDQDDVSQAKWEIPGKVMKNGNQANIPLSRQAIAILVEMRRRRGFEGHSSAFVFPGRNWRKSQGETTLLDVLQRQAKLDTTTHGFRTTFRSWGGDQKGIEREVLEHCIHHILGDDSEMVYNKADQWEKRQEVLQLWADYVTDTVAPRTVAKADLRLVA